MEEFDNPLFGADLNQVKRLVEAGHSVNTLADDGRYLLLNVVMSERRVDVFDYLMSLDETDVNRPDAWFENPLLYMITNCSDEYFARRLVDRGADIHFVDEEGFGFLSILAFFSKNVDNLSIGHLLIEKGVDINRLNDRGKTPLIYACESGNFDWVCMLLYYGADVTIGTDEGLLPLDRISPNMPEDQRFLLKEILFNYTFDDDETTVKLPTLVKAMAFDSELFLKIFHKVYHIDYDFEDLHFVAKMLVHVEFKYFEMFMTKFSHIIQEMMDKLLLLDELVYAATHCEDDEAYEFQEIFNFFLQGSDVADFVQSSVPGTEVIAKLIRIYHLQHRTSLELIAEDIRKASIYKEDVTKMACLMLSYGLTVTTSDLKSVYLFFGYCELFQILLHMDILKTDSDYPAIAALCYNPRLTIDSFYIDYVDERILDYFNDSELKKLIIDKKLSATHKTVKKAKSLPQIPLLVELSRNAARKYIVDRFNIKTSVQFHTILKMLPIGDMNKKIIAFEKKLY